MIWANWPKFLVIIAHLGLLFQYATPSSKGKFEARKWIFLIDEQQAPSRKGLWPGGRKRKAKTGTIKKEGNAELRAEQPPAKVD